jgi:hypothetical protein
MKEHIAMEIVNRINKIAKENGVNALANYKPEANTGGVKCIDIELHYQDYCFIERFNTGMNIIDKDVDIVAGYLLRDLFGDYFHNKLCIEY